MAQHPKIKRAEPTWTEPCIIAAPGPSLASVATQIRLKRIVDQWRIIVVNDAYKLIPCADILYAVDNAWWHIHKDCKGFFGEKWAAHEQTPHELHGNDKRDIADKYDVNLIFGKDGDEFSRDPSFIRYGSNSGFQAINLAMLMGAKDIVLVGFDMCRVDGKAHFFGDHPQGLQNTSDDGYRQFVRHYVTAKKRMPSDVRIINATPGSALNCFEMMSLDAAFESIENNRLHRDRAIANT